MIDGGAELQRVLYALACRQLLPGSPAIRARLIYLKDQPAVFPLLDPDQIFEEVSKFVAAACAALEGGKAVPGVAAELSANDLRLALPVSPGYFRRKRMRFREAAGGAGAVLEREMTTGSDEADRIAGAHRSWRDAACRSRGRHRQDFTPRGPPDAAAGERCSAAQHRRHHLHRACCRRASRAGQPALLPSC